MSEYQSSTIKVNLSTREFEITGEDNFVNEHLEDMLKLISFGTVNNNFTDFKNQVEPLPDSISDKDSIYGNGRVYRVDTDGEIDICKKIGGTSKSERMKKIAMIMLYAKDNTPLNLSELRDTCVKQGCWDGHNASTIFNNPAHFIKKGKSKVWTLELTMEGREAAQQILEELVNVQ